MNVIDKVKSGISIIADHFGTGQGADANADIYIARGEAQALAKVTELFGQDIERVEVRIGTHLRGVTPEMFRARADAAAKAFKRETGRKPFALSVNYADELADPEVITIEIQRDNAGTTTTTPKHSLTDKDKAALREEINTEFRYALSHKKGRKSPVLAVRFTCRDEQYDAFLSRADLTVWVANGLRRAGFALAPEFRVDYGFEKLPPNTAPIGEGALSIDVCLVGEEPWAPTGTHDTNHPADTMSMEEQPSHAAGAVSSADTFEIGEEDFIDGAKRQHVRLTWTGVGKERISGDPPIKLSLPAVIKRSDLAATGLSKHDPGSLQVVSEGKPRPGRSDPASVLTVVWANDHMVLNAPVKVGKNGVQRPTHYLVTAAGEETPIVGRKILPTGIRRAEVLIGATSGALGRDVNGTTLRRAVRIELAVVED